MALIKNAEIWHLRADPKRPNAKFNPANPTWEVQIRTYSKEQKKEWEGLGLSVKAVVPDEGAPYWRVNLKKKSIKKGGDAASPVDVVNGKMKPIDPATVGNGSVANIRLFEYTYPKKDGKGDGTAFVLMGIQITKLKIYDAPARTDDFEETETEVIEDDESEGTSSTPTPPAGDSDANGLY